MKLLRVLTNKLIAERGLALELYQSAPNSFQIRLVGNETDQKLCDIPDSMLIAENTMSKILGDWTKKQNHRGIK